MEQMELENHYSVTIIIKIESGKYYRWMLRVKGNFGEEQNIYIFLNCLPNCLLDAERNKTVTTGQRLESMIKTDITSVLPDVIPQKRTQQPLCYIPANT